jgi:hypothetical protein
LLLLGEDTKTVVLSVSAIAGPGGKLFYKGQEYSDRVEVPFNSLVGVIKNGQYYLYHPALGNEEPSHFNSRLAIGKFIEGLTGDLELLAETQEMHSATSMLATESGQESLPFDEDITLSTGTVIRGHSAVVDEGSNVHVECRLQNETRRWVAVKDHIDYDGSDELVYFLPPHFEAFLTPTGMPTTLTDFVLSLDTKIKEKWSNLWGITDYPMREDLVAPLKVYGSVVPALWLHIARMGYDIFQYLEYFPESLKKYIFPQTYESPPVDITEAHYAKLIANIQEARADDQDLFVRLNTVSFVYITLETVKQLVKQWPEKCTEAVAVSGVSDPVELLMIGALTSDVDYKAIGSLGEAAAKNFMDSLVLCLPEVLFPPSASVTIFVSSALDILTGLLWYRHLHGAMNDVLNKSAFDSVKFTIPVRGVEGDVKLFEENPDYPGELIQIHSSHFSDKEPEAFYYTITPSGVPEHAYIWAKLGVYEDETVAEDLQFWLNGKRIKGPGTYENLENLIYYDLSDADVEYRNDKFLTQDSFVDPAKKSPVRFRDTTGRITIKSWGTKPGDTISGEFNVNLEGLQRICADSKCTEKKLEGWVTGEFSVTLK